MQKRSSSETASSVLALQTPANIGAQSQRERIARAMIASCAEKTYAETTITDIVAGARISRTTFYKRFDDKRECFDAALDLGIERVRELAAAAHAPSEPPADAARKAACAIVGLLDADPDLTQFLVGEAHGVEPAVLRRYRRLLVPALAGLWSIGGDAPEPRIDPRLAFGRAQVLIFNQLADPATEDLRELLPELVYLCVAPFAGHEEALRQSRLAVEGRAGNGG
jgi:AcrR family transcriptional regulator